MSHFYEIQLEWVRWLHTFRTPWLDAFFKCLNYFDRVEFLFILIPIVWVGYHWKSGIRLFYFLMMSSVINGALKAAFMEPRPFHLDPSLGVIEVGGYGFPSGAAQTVILLSGILLCSYKNIWTWFLCANYIFWISLSRVYLGVHLPTDILGGWAVGAGVLALYIYARPPVEKWLERQTLPTLLLLSIVAPLLLALLSPPWWVIAVVIGSALCLSRYLKLLLPLSKDRKQFFSRAALGVFGTFLLASLKWWIPMNQTLWATYLQPTLIGLWIGLGANTLIHVKNRLL